MTDDHKAEALRAAMVESIAGGTIGVPGGYASLERDDAVNIVDGILARFDVTIPDTARSALADAWDEGCKFGYDYGRIEGRDDCAYAVPTANPYREGSTT